MSTDSSVSQTSAAQRAELVTETPEVVVAYPETQPTWSVWTALCLVGVIFVLQVQLDRIATKAMEFTSEAAPEDRMIDFVGRGWMPPVAGMVATVVGMALIWLVLSRAGRRPVAGALRMVPPQRLRLPIIAILSVLLIVGLEILTGLLRANTPGASVGPILVTINRNFFLRTAYQLLFAPILNGLLFQGVWFGAVQRLAGRWPAFVLTAALFVAYQVGFLSAQGGTLTSGIVDPAVVIRLAIVGIYLAGLRLVTRSTTAPIFAEMSAGLVSLIDALIAGVSG